MRVLAFASVLLLGALFALANEPAAEVEITVPDVELVDQDGRKVRLYSDLVRGRVVAVNFVFTTCSTICSPMTAIFSSTAGRLGPLLGKEVLLISISLDPTTDTPERLRAYADQFSRRDGWVFLTGPRERVVEALKALGGWVPDKTAHGPMVLLGNEPAGRWQRTFGLASPKTLASDLRALVREASPHEEN